MTETVASANAALNARVALLTAGTGGDPTLEILSAANAVLYTFALNSTTPYDAAASGTASTPATISGGTFTAAGTGTQFRGKDRDGTAVFTLPLASSVTISSGVTYDLTGSTLTQPLS